MANVHLTLPEELVAQFQAQAEVLGVTTQQLMQKAIGNAATFFPPMQKRNIPGFDQHTESKKTEVEAEYQRLGYDLGWTFISCPWEYRKSSKLLMVSLNPGGRRYIEPMWSQEMGSAYRIEAWPGRKPGEAAFQQQILGLYEMLGLKDDEVFSAKYIPFRSPNWENLKRKTEAKEFSDDLWRWLLPQVKFDRIVCIGKVVTAKSMVELLGAKFEGSFRLGWDPQTGDRYRLPDGRPLVALPHLSRFAIIGRQESQVGLRELFELG